MSIRTIMFSFSVLSALTLLSLSTEASSAQSGPPTMVSDPLAVHLVGDWLGSGTYDGNELSLTRTWSLELGGSFLEGDMGVTMANGASFGALMYWKRSDDDGYDVIWLDAVGRMQGLRPERDPDSGRVWADYLDAYAEDGAEPRRWEFEPAGPDGYVERLYRRDGDGWEVLTEWRFRRATEGR